MLCHFFFVSVWECYVSQGNTVLVYNMKYVFQGISIPNLSRVGTSITRRTSRNGQISLSTNKRQTPRNGNKILGRTVTSGDQGFGMAVSKMDVDIDTGEGIIAYSVGLFFV
jgi:hypothetical protein